MTIKVIIADDNFDGAAALAGFLRLKFARGIEVVVVHDGVAALEAASVLPSPQAMVLDVDMPRKSGIETAAAVRMLAIDGRQPTLIAMSGDERLLSDADSSGHFQSTLRKPVDSENLLRLLLACED